MKALLLLVSFLPVVAFGAPSFPPGRTGWSKAADDVGLASYKAISRVCKASKDHIALSLSHNQEANSRCEIARTITHACVSYAQQASGWRMTNRMPMADGKTTPDMLWHSLMNGGGGNLQVGAFAAWESATYAPQSLTSGDLYWKDYTACMSHYRR